MAKFFFTLILLLIFFFSLGCLRESYSEIKEYIYPYDASMDLHLTNRVGHIQIQEWDKDEVSISVEITSRSSSESLARKMVQETKMNLHHKEHRLIIEGEAPSRSDASLRMDYLIKIPSHFNCTIVTSVGDIRIQRLVGNVFLKTGTGSIFLDSLVGEIRVEGGTGDIRLGAIEGDLDVSTSTGDISIDYARGQVHRLETSTGSITATMELVKGTENRIRSSTGDITLFLRGEISAHLWAGVGTGEIHLEGLDLRLEEKDERRIVGILGRGESNLNLQTSTGDIRIIRN